MSEQPKRQIRLAIGAYPKELQNTKLGESVKAFPVQIKKNLRCG